MDSFGLKIKKRFLNVLIFQVKPSKPKEGAAFLDQYLAKIPKNDSFPDLIIFPEHWVLGHQLSDTEALCKVVAKYKIVAVLGTTPELEDEKRFITSLVVGPDGKIIGKYRKRNLTDSGANEPGTEVGIFDIPHLGIRMGVLICFDIESQDLLEETLSHSPNIIVNPIFIHGPHFGNTDLLLSHWKSATETMSRKFEALSSSNNFTLLRVDNPYTGEGSCMGSSLIVGPITTTYAPIMGEVVFPLVIDLQAKQEFFSILTTPPPRERTEKVDNTNNRYSLKALNISDDLEESGAIEGFGSRVLKTLTKADFSNPNTGISFLNSHPHPHKVCDNQIKVWNVSTRKCLHTITHPSSFITLKALSPNIFTTSDDKNNISVVDIQSGKITNNYKTDSQILAIEGSPTSIYCASASGEIHLYDSRSGDVVSNLGKIHQQEITTLSSFSEWMLCSGSFDRTVYSIDTRAPLFSKTLVSQHRSPVSIVSSVCYEDSLPTIISGDYEGSIHITHLDRALNVLNSQPLIPSSLETFSPISGITQSSPNTFFYSTLNSKTIHLCSKAALALLDLHEFYGHTQGITSLSSTQDKLISTTNSGEVFVWTFEQNRVPLGISKMFK